MSTVFQKLFSVFSKTAQNKQDIVELEISIHRTSDKNILARLGVNAEMPRKKFLDFLVDNGHRLGYYLIDANEWRLY
jgi:hypothetical protein